MSSKFFVLNFRQNVYLFLQIEYRVVNYEKCSKEEYFTIGLKGVCHFCAGEEIEYIKLERWEKEYKEYKKLVKVKKEF